MNAKKSLVEFGNEEGYSPEEFTSELLESIIALSMMQLDKKNKRDDSDNDHINWTVSCDDGAKFRVTVEMLQEGV